MQLDQRRWSFETRLTQGLMVKDTMFEEDKKAGKTSSTKAINQDRPHGQETIMERRSVGFAAKKGISRNNATNGLKGTKGISASG